MFNKTIQILAYADDIGLIWSRETEVIEQFTQFQEAAQTMGLHINTNKTKFMRIIKAFRIGTLRQDITAEIKRRNSGGKQMLLRAGSAAQITKYLKKNKN